jgi:hypothetical protein
LKLKNKIGKGSKTKGRNGKASGVGSKGNGK